ncbi:c-type cytochrome [Paucibacter soli]|uniref:c-type cytochrome n=1 Tax=Paucibacter soli TaxID=3133433 RepID=UPI003094E33A
MTTRPALLLTLSLLALPAAAGEEPRFSAGWGFEQRSGPALYAAICAGCHMPDGRGARGAAAYPALAGNARLAATPYLLRMILKGGKAMPAFASVLDDGQVGAVAGEVLRRFGPPGAIPIGKDEVAALRAALQQEEGNQQP